MRRCLVFMSPLDVHNVLTGHQTILPLHDVSEAGGPMIADLVATYPTNKLMGHVVAHLEANNLVFSKPFRHKVPMPIPITKEDYDLLVHSKAPTSH